MQAIRIYSALGRVEELNREIDQMVARKELVLRFRAQQLIEAGFALYDAGRTVPAEALFRRLKEQFPENPDVASILANLFAGPGNRKQDAKAAADLLRDSDDPILLANEGASRLSAGDAEAARRLLSRAVQLEPASDLVWYNLGLANSKLEMWVEAETAFARAVALKAGFSKAIAQRGLARLRLGRNVEAEADARRALEVQPGLKLAYYVLYECAKFKGNMKEAEEYLRLQQAP
jgi:tetratricopeptide (TPR) repeat protein